MKAKTKTFKGFLKKALMEGEQQIVECILSFNSEGLKINANDPIKQARSMSWLMKDGFKEYEKIGNVGMNDLPNVIKVLDRFGEFVVLKKEGNLLTVSGESDGRKKSVDIELIAETFLTTETGAPDLEFEETFQVSATHLKDILKDVSMNKDATLTFTTKDKLVEVSNTGKYKFLNTINAPTCKGGVTVTFGQPFMNAVANLDGMLELSVKNDYPVKIMEKLETSVITLIVAPRIDGEVQRPVKKEEPKVEPEEESKGDDVETN